MIQRFYICKGMILLMFGKKEIDGVNMIKSVKLLGSVQVSAVA